MNTRMTRIAVMSAGALAIGLGGCSQYVKKADFSSAIQQLQQKQQQQQQEIDSIKQEMQSRFSKLNAKVTQMAGRVSIDTVAHFAFNKSTLRDQDKPALKGFAKTMKQYHPDALITVEGFADPAGSRSYNKKLGMKRADAVRNYLVNTGGLSPDEVRAVSYGESRDRQVTKGATHQEGQDNRRVSLTVDSTGSNSMAQTDGQ